MKWWKLGLDGGDVVDEMWCTWCVYSRSLMENRDRIVIWVYHVG